MVVRAEGFHTTCSRYLTLYKVWSPSAMPGQEQVYAGRLRRAHRAAVCGEVQGLRCGP